MKISKRDSFFETNSSSTHAICLSNKKDRIAGDFKIRDNTIYIEPGEFGWGPSQHFDSDTKASYCYTYAMNHDQSKLEILTKTLKKITGYDIEYGACDSDYYKYGYIDHQSVHVCEFVFMSEENLENFIFCPSSILVIDNDNE